MKIRGNGARPDNIDCINGSLCAEPKIFSWLKYEKLNVVCDGDNPWGGPIGRFCRTVKSRYNIMDKILRGFGCIWVRNKDDSRNTPQRGDCIPGYRLNDEAQDEMLNAQNMQDDMPEIGIVRYYLSTHNPPNV